jgi:L-aminopeptidase/D-esterase-like protein
MALGVDGVRVGTWTAPGAVSGCTVVLPPEGPVAWAAT